MPAKSSKLITHRLLLLGVLLCILGCIGCVALNTIDSDGEQLPLRSLRVTIAEGQREELFDQLRKFADKHGFEYQIADFNTNGEIFQFWMSRDDIKIISRNPFDPGIFRISLYYKSPTVPASQETVDDLVNDLKSLISEIPNATISEEK